MNTTRCHTYAWCVETGDHFEHYSPETVVTPPRKNMDPLASAYTYDLGYGPAVSFQTEDFTPEQARTKARELRTLADAIEVMADAVDAIRAEQPAGGAR
ncbi:hypothetical protein FNH09_40485 [Streptomyces adustus]|uniref:Uncharacterized protein n=1 Tax=Streptomyces adustus TaxID=1609272 RepID=A0A5N8VSX5_9ACTN|nr:hypothetical protein [Streptomyces adustus]MPY37264.1 hypothetical protein [Streptomyces adustus]